MVDGRALNMSIVKVRRDGVLSLALSTSTAIRSYDRHVVCRRCADRADVGCAAGGSVEGDIEIGVC